MAMLGLVGRSRASTIWFPGSRLGTHYHEAPPRIGNAFLPHLPANRQPIVSGLPLANGGKKDAKIQVFHPLPRWLQVVT